MEGEILNIQAPIIFDESIAHCEIHAHQPYASSTFNNSDEIRIAVQNQDHCLLPSKSSLHVHGRIVKTDGQPVTNTSLVSNAICHLFEEARYEINAIEIDRNKNVGITSLMKNYVSLNPGQSSYLQNTGWLKVNDNNQSLTIDTAYFDVAIPLNMIFGFAEDYHKIIVNAKHEIILKRSQSNANAVSQTVPAAADVVEAFKIEINKIEWLLPSVRLSDTRKFQLLKYIEKDPSIPISFRTWELYEYPLLPTTSNHVWTVKTSTQLEKPRFVILGFQTNRKNNTRRSSSLFDHCNLTNVKLILNDQCYPYSNLNLNIARNQYALLYEMYTNFQANYYGKDPQPLLSRGEFIEHAPLAVIDCSKQNESLKYGPVDVRLEFQTSENFPAQTSAYCLILHDRIVEYKPISGGVKKLV